MTKGEDNKDGTYYERRPNGGRLSVDATVGNTVGSHHPLPPCDPKNASRRRERERVDRERVPNTRRIGEGKTHPIKRVEKRHTS